MLKLSYRFLCWALFFSWLATLIYVSSLTKHPLSATLDIPWMDKIAHLTAFFGGSFFCSAALQSSRPQISLLHFFIAFLITGSIGFGDEFYQLLTPGRQGADPLDMTANIIGAFLGASTSFFIHVPIYRLFRRR